MRIRSLIQRTGGHVAVFPGVRYAFNPPDWACDCTNAEHVARFREIPEGYVVEAACVPLPVAADDAPEPLAVGRRRGRRNQALLNPIMSEMDLA